MKQELKQYTLKSLINSEFQVSEEDTVTIQNIIIPRVQRDYAQGRCGKSEKRVREKFLDALFNAVINKKKITLDFVYGDVEDGDLTLLDGQQRLTTLFLLHWYAAKKENLSIDEYEFLKHFSYATRFSSRDFCKSIVEKDISFDCEKLSAEIIDQAWYPFDWKNDPTIQSMLVMIDAISDKFSDVENLWTTLIIDNCISFYFLPLKEMGLSDELYIKMNSRGKPLTDYEHFKAEFLELIKEQDEELYQSFSKKIDTNWADILFPYRGENQIIDDEFMRYFKYVSHIICYKDDVRSKGNDKQIEYDEFKIAKQLYSKENKKSIDNLKFLESAFDCWKNCDIQQFFSSIFYTNKYEYRKTKLFLKGEETINLFKDCLDYHTEFNGRNRQFSLNTMLLFYAVLLYKLNESSIKIDDFKRRIRIVRNLTENSQYEIREFDQYGNNQMQRLLEDIYEIIINGNVKTDERGFNLLQKQEEKEKLEWEKSNSDYHEELYKLEDHNLLKGTISIIGLEHPENFLKFRMLFSSSIDKDLISKAMLCLGDYSQNLDWKTQLGVKSKASVWSDLFHPTKQRNENGHFRNTSDILNQLLSKLPDNEIEIANTLEKIASEYLNSASTLKDWRYYFVKYDTMRYDTYGMYWWHDRVNSPYEVIVMHTAERLNGNNWNMFAYGLTKMHPDKFELSGNNAYQGDKLKVKGADLSIDVINDKILILKNDQIVNEFEIKQKDGIDMDDRIEFIYSKLTEIIDAE